MTKNPSNKKQRLSIAERNDEEQIEQKEILTHTISPLPSATVSTPSSSSFVRSRTPMKTQSQTEGHFHSHTVNTSSSLQAPSLQPPDSSSRGRDNKTYSQSPPRSPGRSPTRKLELIQLSPVKKTRLELQKIYDSQQQQTQNKIGRLCINKLILNNFKSYAGEQIVGPFNSSFSAVVGPNGSGKSNVIDSMLFVFGFRASKMRQDRLSDLIHNSEQHPNLNSCSVEVHFHYVIDSEDVQTRVNHDKPELIVTRKAFRNNSSKYYINGNESNYTEVTRLLKDEGIDLDHKRFLILQGEVENIAQMKPKAEKEGEDGLLEYLEDIIGTSQYKSQIDTSMAQIEAVNEICLEKENRFHIVDDEKKSLESEKDNALEFLKKEKQLLLLKSKIFQYNIFQNNLKLSSTLEKYGIIKAKLDLENEKHSTDIENIDQLKTESQHITTSLKKYEEEEKKHLQEKRSLNANRVSIEENLKNLIQKEKKTKELIDTSNRSLKQSKSNLQILQDTQKDNEKDLDDLNKELEIEREKLEEIKLSLKDKTVGISLKIAEYEKELEPWNEKVESKRAEIQLVESEIALMKESHISSKDEIESMKKEISTDEQEQERRKDKVEKLKQEKIRLKNDITSGISECSSAKKRLNEMEEVLISQRQKAIDARAALSTAENKNKVLAALTKMQKSGRINGFHGRLGDLGLIDEKYDIAISTACPRLEDIVVETVECGQQCIEYLRKNKLGYARFILLDKLRNFNTNPIQTPENVSRLFDLIESKSKQFIPAFYSVLRDTLVSDSLSQANRVAYGRKKFRVVTIDGKLIDISGTISGGGNHVSRGLMNLKQKQSTTFNVYSEEEVAQLESVLAEREENYKIASDTFHQMENELKRFQANEPEVEISISQILMDIDSWDSELILKKQQLSLKESAHNGVNTENEDYKKAEMRLKSLTLELESLEEQTKDIILNIQSLKDEIMDIGGSNLQIQNSKVDSIMQRIDIINSKQKKGRSLIKKSENEIKKYTKNIDTNQEDLDSYNKQILALNEKKDHTESMITNNERVIENLLDLKFELNEKLQSTSQQLSDMEKDVAKFKSLKIDLEDKMEKLNNLIMHHRKEIRKFENEVENLKLRDVSQVLQLINEEENSKHESIKYKIKSPDVLEQSSNKGNTEIFENEETEEQNMCIDEPPDIMNNGLPIIAEKELKKMDIESIEARIGQLQDYIENDTSNVEVLEEYGRRLTEYRTRKLDLNDAVAKRDEMKEKLDELKRKRFDEFMQGFGIISMTLKEMYQMITMGGNAELELVDSLDPFSEGVTFSVMPPKKSWRNITNLSGGEKTLSSLALVFALHKYKPTPLYVMDEIDAALDFRNVSIVANYIKQRTKNAQFIVISLRNNMFELAQNLVGIYKRENMTKSATIKNIDVLKSSS